MKTILCAIFVALTVPADAFADSPSTSPSNDLIGRWRVISMGVWKSSDSPIWEFDDRSVAVTSKDGVRKSQYTLAVEDGHRVIYLTPEGETVADRIGWYEIKEGKLRLQLALGGKKPTKWIDELVFVFESIPK